MAAGDWYAALVAEHPAAASVTRPAELHITLAFLGDCTADQIDAAWTRLLATPPPSLTARLGDAAAFGSTRHPNLWGCDLENIEPLRQWMAQHRDALYRASGSTPDTRPPRPHLTLLRLPRRVATQADARLQSRLLHTVQNTRGAALTLDRVALYCRAPNDSELHYQRLRTLKLKPPATR